MPNSRREGRSRRYRQLTQGGGGIAASTLQCSPVAESFALTRKMLIEASQWSRTPVKATRCPMPL
jgi:hypothetical protein